MAHFTGLKQLQNHPHRAGFDIGSKNVFSAKCGELLPVFWDLGIPGCAYDIDRLYYIVPSSSFPLLLPLKPPL